MNDNIITKVASALKTDGHLLGTAEQLAYKATEAMGDIVAAKMADIRLDAAQKMAYMAMRQLYECPVLVGHADIDKTINELRTIHGRLGRLRENAERIQNAEAPEAV